MLHYDAQEAADSGVTISIGRDAGWYHPEVPNVQWITDVQPFGYRAVTGLFQALKNAMETGSRGSFTSAISLGKTEDQSAADPLQTSETGKQVFEEAKTPAGFRRFTTPFAPDQSGAVSVLYDMGGICVICDAGGCTGNICGFDEPRWFGSQSAVFSAGLRDMDAILGRDDRLVEKLADAAQIIPASFAAIVGTPVPAVIGTDYRALCRMASKKTGLPVIGVNTDGMEYYDKGLEKTYLALVQAFCPASEASSQIGRTVGIWGYSPLDFAGILTEAELRKWVREQGYDNMICCGAGTKVQDLPALRFAEKNLVLSPAGTAAAKWLEKQYGTPWDYHIPGADGMLEKTAPQMPAGRTLVVHQQLLADTFCGLLRQKGIEAHSAGFFMKLQEAEKTEFVRLREETDLRTLVQEKGIENVIADRSLQPILAGLPVRFYHLPHFAVSGEQL